VIEKIKNALKKRKAKLFFLFLFLSSLAWFISNLSIRYQGNTTFELEFVNPPDSMMLVSASKKNMDVRLDAVGFQFLTFNLIRRKVEINLSEAQEKGRRYYVTSEAGKRQIDKQMTNGVKLLDVAMDTLFFEFYSVISKKVPVKSMLSTTFAQNYLLDGEIHIVPDSIIIKGPKNEVDAVEYVKTNTVRLSDLNENFTLTTQLIKEPSLVKTQFSKENVQLSGSVSRFSEKVIRVPVQVINLPENTSAQTFPEEVSVLIKASITDLKKIGVADLRVIGDYKSIRESGQNSMPLSISKQPAAVHSVELSQKHVDFILKRE